MAASNKEDEVNANLKNTCPCGPSCACVDCRCNESACSHAPEEGLAEGPACFCGTGCKCE